ncbi:hypothetical protein KO561_12745 [Radiobacillus kanasensis]|uniref:hypothetical protein n=1 Tax=Radiobacillus kanasensis TaxID=2844358 RepID=UPI001E30CD2F|nr:hypothetical protein [Radiobacillus kanasensis]UFT98070.1 hypothetical protein KO561_12745 [Radiobacillus kanasensis]
MVPFYLCIAGLIYLFEYVLLVLFESYEYFPGVFRDDYFNNILGANISNGFIVPSVTVFISVYNLGFWWIILIIIGFVGIEELFMYLGVYHHNWWKTVYTSGGLLLIFFLGKYIWRLIRYHSNQFTLRVAVLYFVNVVTQGTFMFYLVAIFHLFLFQVSWFDDPSRGHIAFVTLYFFIDSVFYSLMVVSKIKWFYQALFIIGLTCVNVLLQQIGILKVSGNWVIALITFLQLGELFLLINLRNLLFNNMLTR